jgi:hypothetical protein
MINFSKGYQNPRNFGSIVEVLPLNSQIPAGALNVTPASTGQELTSASSVATAVASVASPYLNTQDPVQTVENAVLWLGVPTLAYVFITGSGLTRWLLGALGVGLVYLHVNGELAENQ